MEKVGILVVSYGSREVAFVDAFLRSVEYKSEIFIADKQANPFNIKNAAKHTVIPNLNINAICNFAKANKDRIDFGIVGPEKPIVEGIRDLIEKKTKIPIICPTKEYAIEESKVRQRLLFQEIVPEANPRYRIFDPKDNNSQYEVRKAVYRWLDSLNNQAVIKPDKPAAGKGVGVWGDHFVNREQLFQHFLSNFEHGSVVIEEKLEGEESSFQAFSDGKHLVPVPDVRDYKRAFEEDRGPNTGGMGSYKDVGDILPFLTAEDRKEELEIASRTFEKLKQQDNTSLRGVPLYFAFMHTGEKLKILETNSRPGDPEIINILPILKNDFVDICYKMLEGNLNRVETEKAATVVTYKVPPTYGEYASAYPTLVRHEETGTPIDLSKAVALSKQHGDQLRIYPGSVELRGDKVFAAKSRSVAIVGTGRDIETAREVSLQGIKSITGGALWYRTDIASPQHIGTCKKHMENLRSNL